MPNSPPALTAVETGISDSGRRLDWYRSPIDRSTLLELNRKNNWRPLLQNLGILGFSVATGALALWAHATLEWPWVVATVFLHCTFYGFFGGGAGGHELSHKNMFRNRWLNELFLYLNGFLTWLNPTYFRVSHAKHHQYTVHYQLDGEVELPQELKWYSWLTGFTLDPIHVFNTVKSLRYAVGGKKLGTPWEQKIFADENPEKLRSAVRFARILILGHLVLGVVFVASGNWILLLLVTFAQYFASWFKLVTHMPQHIGLEPDVADWRRGTRTYLAGPVTRFFYWNMNYHVEHHMFAAVPFYNLPKLRAVIANDLPVASRGLIATWREIFDTLRKQKRDPSYIRPLSFPEPS